MKKTAVAVTCFSIMVFQVLLVVGCASAKYPEVSDEGLVRIDQSSLDAVYEAPAFDLGSFQKIAVEQCSVEFRDNWLRDQNVHRGPSRRVTPDDMERIEQQVAASCHDIFRAELEKVVFEDGDEGGEEKILTVRPAIDDLDIAAPDVMTPGRQSDLATNPARMSLRLELVDSAAGETVARVIDHRRADETASFQQTSVVGNMAEVERILRYWAALVRAQLERDAD